MDTNIYLYIMKRMEEKLIELMGTEAYLEFSKEITKEEFGKYINSWFDCEFKDFINEHFDQITK